MDKQMEAGSKYLVPSIMLLLINLTVIDLAQANECYRIERQLNYADSKLRQGGNSSYMKLWRQSRDHNHEELIKCKRRFGNGEPQITVYSGERKAEAQNRVVVSSNINDPALQQLIKTCNHWINESDRNPSPENKAFRDNSCRDVKAASDRITNPQETFLMVRNRSLKECIKPNQVIDNEVKECMEGAREPTWASRE